MVMFDLFMFPVCGLEHLLSMNHVYILYDFTLLFLHVVNKDYLISFKVIPYLLPGVVYVSIFEKKILLFTDVLCLSGYLRPNVSLKM